MFLTLEGPEGAGKSTLARRIVERLRESGRETVLTREPGEGDFGIRVREILLHGEEMVPEAELFLFLADRAQHVRSFIQPALEAGKWVLCDRYADSTLVYQHYARGLDGDFVRRANAFATGGFQPDLTFLLDLPAEVGLARLQGKDRLDAAPLSFHRRVRNGFLTEAQGKGRWRVLNADQPPEKVEEAAWREIETLFSPSRVV
ncbi:dTMP kinase [soil metagenome]